MKLSHQKLTMIDCENDEERHGEMFSYDQMERKMKQLGYMEGADKGRKEHFQIGFNDGYECGLNHGMKAGESLAGSWLKSKKQEVNWTDIVIQSCYICQKYGEKPLLTGEVYNEEYSGLVVHQDNLNQSANKSGSK